MSIRKKTAVIIFALVLIVNMASKISSLFLSYLAKKLFDIDIFNFWFDLSFSSALFLILGLIAAIYVSEIITRSFQEIEERAIKINEINNRTNLLLNAMPLTCHLWNKDFKIFECNDESSRLFKTNSKEEFLNSFFTFSPEYQPDGQVSSEKAAMLIKKAFEEGKCVSEWMHQLLDGTPIPTEIILVRVEYENDYIIAGYLRDLREQKQMIKEIEHRDNLLNTINTAATVLLKSDADVFEKDLQFCMGIIAEVMEFDRVYVWKNYKKGGKLYCAQLYEWSDGMMQKGGNFVIDVSYTEIMPEWEKILSSGRCIHSLVRNMLGREKIRLSEKGVLSVFIVPVFLSDEFWGYVGFDDCHKERRLSENEQSILHSGGLLVANAILRNEIMKNLGATAAKLEAVVSNFPGIIWSVNLNYIFTLYRGRLLEKTGEKPSKTEGLKINEYLNRKYNKDANEKLIPSIRKTFADGPQDWISDFENSKFQNRTTPIFDDSGKLTGVLGIVNDITELSRLQAELELALKGAHEVSRAKSEFLANMSHEMRTPLNAIICLSELCLDSGGLSRELSSNLEKIYNAGRSLLFTVNDILDISKIEAGKLEIVSNEYALPSLIYDTITQNIIRIGEKPIKFELNISEDLPSCLYGDENRIKQILNNILTNAFKYTMEGKVELSITCEYEGEDVWMILKVWDTGIGIKKDDMDRLFTNYTQVDAKFNSKIEGTGLGLSITKKIVQMMDGSIALESEYGKGSIFTVRIKQRAVNNLMIGAEVVKNLKNFNFSDPTRRKNSRLARNKKPYARVLVVDDVPTNLDVARGMMGLYGMKIDCVCSGQEAIDAIQKEKIIYDAIFMDHMMPEMDGIEAARIIREEIGTEYAKNIPIIALTANAIVGNEEMFLSNGFQAFLSKPIDAVQLDAVINTWIRDKQCTEISTSLENERTQINTENAIADTKISLGILENAQVEGVNFAQGLKRYSNELTYLDIIRSFCLHTPALLKKLLAFIGDGTDKNQMEKVSLSEYRIIVHGLKGSCYGISANLAGSEAKELEMAARAGDIERLTKNTFSFVLLMESLLKDLGNILKKAAENREPKKPASAPDTVLFSRLLENSKLYKADEMEQIIRELESFEYKTGGELICWLREQMDNLEYEVICSRLEREVHNAGKQ